MKALIKTWLSISLISIGIGFGLLIIALIGGYRSKETVIKTNAEYQDLYENIHSIDIDMDYGEVKILKGDSFTLSAQKIVAHDFESFVEDGIWYIREESEYFIEIFDFKLPLSYINLWGVRHGPKITITLPEDFIAENFSLNLSAGSVDIEKLHGKEGEFHVSAGELRIRELNLRENSNYILGTGELFLEDARIHNIRVDCKVGSVKINGVVTGNNYIDNDIGEVSLKLHGEERDYSFEISSNLGSVKVGDKEFHGFGREVRKNKDTDHSFDLNCELGSIAVDFHK